MNRFKILFYSDSPTFGGHEKYSSDYANLLAEKLHMNVYFCYHNQKFEKVLSDKITKIHLTHSTFRPFPFLFNYNPIHIIKNIFLFKKIKPNLVIVVQGNIEFCLKGLIAAKYLRIPVFSYIPLGFNFHEVNASFSYFRDRIDSLFYKLPDKFITCTEYQKKLLQRFTRRKIQILSNYFPMRKDYQIKFPEKIRNIAIVGRIYFKHKNQEIALKLAQKFDFDQKIYIIGDGVDLPSLEKEIRKLKLTDKVILKGYMDNKEAWNFVKQNIDLVLIPSFFEGMPTVLLEALKYNTLFLISDREFIKEYKVPSIFLIDPTDPDNILNKMQKLLMNKKDTLQKYSVLKNRMIRETSEKRILLQLKSIIKIKNR